MGIYSNNSTTLNGEEIIADEAYATSFGALELMVECQQNDLALFNHVIGCDLREAVVNLSDDEYVAESTVALNEANAKRILTSAVVLLDKIIAKIKAIFDKFIGKLNVLFTQDVTKLYKKYQTAWDTNDYSKMAVKGYRSLKNIGSEVIDLNVFKNIEISDAEIAGNYAGAEEGITSVGSFLAKALGETGEVEAKDLDAKIEERMFEKGTDEAGYVSRDKDDIEAIMTNKNLVKDIKEAKNKCLDRLSILKKQAKSLEQSAIKQGAESDAFVGAHKVVKNINNATSACTKAFNSYTKYIKKAIAQSKKVFVMAATYTPKRESVYADAYGEVLAEEVMNFFDDED